MPPKQGSSKARTNKQPVSKQKRKTLVFDFLLTMSPAIDDDEISEFFFSLEKIIYKRTVQAGQNLLQYLLEMGMWMENARRMQPWQRKMSAKRFVQLSAQECMEWARSSSSLGFLPPTQQQPQEEEAVVISSSRQEDDLLPDPKQVLGLHELKRAVLCPKCRSTHHMVSTGDYQLRRGDEGHTTYFKCENPLCRHQWNES